MTERKPLSNPGVQFPPPLLFIGGFGAAALLEHQLVSLRFPGVKPVIVEVLGVLLLIAGISMMVWGLAAFRRAMTAIFPNQPANELVRDGPYRYSRNPMYVGLTTAFVGGSFIIDSVWPLVLLPVVLALLYLLVIRREEAYLADAFGEQYRAYRRQVRRWF